MGKLHFGVLTYDTIQGKKWEIFLLKFQKVLPPMVGWNFLQAGSSLPDIDGPASAAIWANCWVGDDPGDLPTSYNCSASMTLLLISSWSSWGSCVGAGTSTGVEGF